MKILTLKNSVLTGVLVLVSTLATQSVVAAPKSIGIDKRQKNQMHKIVRGIKSGDLTLKEIYRLEKQQRKIHQKEHRFKSDGNFTRKERAKIQRDLARASRSIYRAKHN